MPQKTKAQMDHDRAVDARSRQSARESAAATDVAAEQADKGTLARAASAGRAARESTVPVAEAGATRAGYKLAKKPSSLGGGYYWKKKVD